MSQIGAEAVMSVAQAVMGASEQVASQLFPGDEELQRLACSAGLLRAVAGFYARLTLDSNDPPAVAFEACATSGLDCGELAAELVRANSLSAPGELLGVVPTSVFLARRQELLEANNREVERRRAADAEVERLQAQIAGALA